MKIHLDSLLEGAKAARGTTVVVDVFRAFTCAPLLFHLGVKRSILVSTPDEAFELKKGQPDLLLIGETGGVPIEGFDLGNSPSQILSQEPGFFQGRTVVQRTSSGVQGAIAALEGADEVLLGSFSLASSIAKYITDRSPEVVSVVAMGIQLKENAPEDEWCARYIAHLLGHGEYDHIQAMREIIFHRVTQKFLLKEKQYFPPEDPIICLQRDVYDFVLKARRENGLVVAEKYDR